jgi:hypothetical protein
VEGVDPDEQLAIAKPAEPAGQPEFGRAELVGRSWQALGSKPYPELALNRLRECDVRGVNNHSCQQWPTAWADPIRAGVSGSHNSK